MCYNFDKKAKQKKQTNKERNKEISNLDANQFIST